MMEIFKSKERKEEEQLVIKKAEEKMEEELQKNIKNEAYKEAEIELGTDVSDDTPADVSRLRNQNFDYTSRVTEIVKSKLEDSEWVNRTKDNIKNQYVSKKNNDDKTIGTNKDILMSHAHRIDEDNKRIEKLKGELEA